MMPGNLVAPFAMDLAPNRGGDIYYKTSQDELLIQWNKVKDFADWVSSHSGIPE